MRSIATRTPPVRAALWAGAVVGATYLLYLLVGNLLLNTAIGRSLANRQPTKAQVGWGSIGTWWPGRFTVKDLRIAGHVRRTVWSVQADEVSGRVALWPLLRKELRVTGVSARGVAGGASLIDVVREPAAPRPGGWTMRFDDVAVSDIRHAYFNDMVLTGTGTARAGFLKQLHGGPMQVMPSQFSFKDATLWREGTRLLDQAQVKGGLEIDRHRREEAPGLRKLLKMVADLDIVANTVGVRVSATNSSAARIGTEQQAGHLQGQLGWVRGELRPGSTLKLDLPVDARIKDLDEHARVVALAQVTSDGVHLKSDLIANGDTQLRADADLMISGRQVPLPLQPHEIAARTSGHVDADWHFDSLLWLNPLVPVRDVVTFNGAGRVFGSINLHDGKLAAGSRLEIPAVAATALAMDDVFTGTAHAVVEFAPTGDGRWLPHLALDMPNFAVAPQAARDEPYVRGNRLDLTIDTREAVESLEELKQTDRVHLVFRNAVVPDLRVYNRLLPHGHLQINGGTGALSGDLLLDEGGKVGKGNVEVAANQAQLTFGGLSLRGDLDVKTLLRKADLGQHLFVADGSSVALRNVTVVTPSGDTTTDWWATVDFDSARFDWDAPFSVDSAAKVRMRDVSLLLALYAEKKDLPRFVEHFVDRGEAEIAGRVKWQGKTLQLQQFRASNDRLDLQANLLLQDGNRNGDLLIQWGRFDLGVELLDGQRKLHFRKARDWYEQQTGGDSAPGSPAVPATPATDAGQRPRHRWLHRSRS